MRNFFSALHLRSQSAEIFPSDSWAILAQASDPGSDTLMGGFGNDTLFGMDGDDRLAGGLGADVFWGMAGRDTVTYLTRPEGLHITADGLAFSGATNERDTINTDVEKLEGGNGPDLVLGSPRNDFMYGGPGNDTLAGFDGNDTLAGEDGNDYLTGGSGSELMMGGFGNDVIYARDGAAGDIVWGFEPGIYDGSIDWAYRDSGDWINDVDYVL